MKLAATVITIVITFIVAVIITLIAGWLWFRNKIDAKLAQLANETKASCFQCDPITYRLDLRPSPTTGIYAHSTAVALFDIGKAVSLANCDNLLPVPLPPPFSQQRRIVGVDPSDGAERMFCYIFWNDRMACFGFTGTFFQAEWYDDLNYKLVTADKINGATCKTKVHRGFYAIYMAIRCKLWSWWDSYGESVKRLFITGHSLGGALSTLCAFDFAEEIEPKNLIHYSFASPRVGNVEFSHQYDERVPYGFRVYNTEDLVVSLPPSTFMSNTYQHVCESHGGVPFTKSLGSLGKDHVDAYAKYMPICVDNRAPCLLT